MNTKDDNTADGRNRKSDESKNIYNQKLRNIITEQKALKKSYEEYIKTPTEERLKK